VRRLSDPIEILARKSNLGGTPVADSGRGVLPSATPVADSGRATQASFCRTRLLTPLLVLMLASPLFAQRELTQIPDPDPEIERQSFQVAAGFAVNLFAADPLIAKPIQMNFDARGRLWLVSSSAYPQIQPGQKADDKVLILEDRDGDGRAETTTIFADGLLIPTGLEPGDGGVYVANSTELLHLKDTDGDGKADARRVVLSGFGTEDTHHILHTFRWGPDGMLYFNQSVYIHSHIETPHGVRRLGGGGIWQLRPETMELDIFIRGLINPWGHAFDRWGQSFATDGAGFEGITYALPGGSFGSIPNPPRYVQGLNPGSPKYCGLEVLSGRHMPDDWQGNLLTNDFRGNRVCRFVLSEDGAGFAAQEQPELIRTRHVAFRPIDVKMGPDGAIYIADWYNPIIQHGEVDFRDPRRDHTRGRIWRVTAKGRSLVERPKLADASTEALLDALKAPEDWTRHFAKRVLKERGPSVLPALAAWVKHLNPADPEVEHHRLEALWVYQSLDVVEPGLLERLLNANDPRARAAAVRVARAWHPQLNDPLNLLSFRVLDDHPRVRLEAVRALAHIPDARAAALALRALDRPMDRFLDYALWLTARELAPQWLPLVKEGRFDFEGQSARLLFALEAVGTPEVVGPALTLLRSGRVPGEQEGRVLDLIAAQGGPRELGSILDLVVADATPTPRRASLLAALVHSTQRRKVRPEGDLTRLGPLLDAPDETLRTAAAQAVGLWRVEPLRGSLRALAEAESASDPVRWASLDALAQLGDPASRRTIEALTRNDRPAATRLRAASALAVLDLRAGASKAAEVLASLPPGADPSALIGRFLERKGGASALAEALQDRKLNADVAKLAVRATRASGRDEPALRAARAAGGGWAGAPTPPTAAEKATLVADVLRLGDPARGEAIFRRADPGCLKCHAIGGAGGQVGPDLASIGASAPVDYLVDSLLEPGKAVKENYNALTIATDDGRVLTGIKIRQNDVELILRDADDREVAIPLSAIEDQKPAGSLMPSGLADTLTRGELIDLLRFLSELGKAGSYSVGPARVVRRWRVAEQSPGALPALSGPLDAAASDPRLRWTPAYSLVSGSLPRDALPPWTLGSSRISLARADLDVTTPGPIRLLVNAPEALILWLDGHRIEPQSVMTVDLATGRHTLTFAIDLNQLGDGLRCELADAPGSSARAQVVSGK
jgi:putative heme-binding domain-containing protein